MKGNQNLFGLSFYTGVFLYGKICIVLLLLSGLGNLVFSQENSIAEKVIREANSQMATDSLRGIDNDPELIQATACVSTYTNQTVSSTVSVEGCATLTVQNVTVSGTGNLSLTAPNGFVINQVFAVQPGGKLDMTIKLPQYIVMDYTYDNAGNRITRQSILTTLSSVNDLSEDTETLSTIEAPSN